MIVDPQIVSWLLIGAASLCAFMIGRNTKPKTDDVIESTMLYLIHNNYVRARRDENGEWDLLKLNEK